MLSKALDVLEKHYGQPKPPRWRDPWLWVLWENVAYLAGDDRRHKAFELLKRTVGTQPERIAAATDEALGEVGRFGIMAEGSVQKMRQCADIVLKEFDGDLKPVLKLPLAKAKKALQKFPGIGAPGAEKILLFCGALAVLGLESNGMRVLLRLGYGEEQKNYAAMYRSVQDAALAELPAACADLTRAYILLRRHGVELCKRNEPKCDVCPLAKTCRYFAMMAK